MYRALYPKDDIDRLYVARKEREVERGLISIGDWVDLSIQGLKNYIKKSKERLIKAANNSIENRSRDRKWEVKQLHVYFKQQTVEIVHDKT